MTSILEHTPALRATPLERGPSSASARTSSREGCPKGGRCGLVLIASLLALCVARAAAVTPLPDDPACSAVDRTFMLRANELAIGASGHGNGSYGAILVKNGKIIGEFEACSTTASDPTMHAETGLIALVSKTLGLEALKGSILYTSTEPCIMCCGAIRNAGIREFVYGVTALQVTRLRGGKLPEKPLQCREVFARGSATNPTVIRGPLMEAEGLVVHAIALSRVVR
jgi:tRNA(Arg) A34 adenosine deaminase TadA